MSRKTGYRSTPLHRVSSHGYLELARFLVEHGADVSAEARGGSTPLHPASIPGHEDLVPIPHRVLRRRVGQGKGRDEWCMWMSRSSSLSTAPTCAENNFEGQQDDPAASGISPISPRLWSRGHGAVSSSIHMAAPTVTSKDNDGWNSVLLASTSSEEGVNVSAKDNDRCTRSAVSTRSTGRGSVDLMQFLRLAIHGADVKSKDDDGRSLLR